MRPREANLVAFALGTTAARVEERFACGTPDSLDEGRPLDVGRKTRVVPTAIRLALEALDCGYRISDMT